MSRIVKPLTNTTINNLKPQAKEYIKSDGKGLWLRINPTGSKTWYFSYKYGLSRKKVCLGAYPDLSLATAREIAQDYRGLLLQNIDPANYRKNLEKYLLEKEITLEEMAIKWRDKRLMQGKLKKVTINEAFRRIELHILPIVGNLNIKDVSIKTIYPAIEPLKHSNTLYKINIALNQIFQLAEDEDLISKNPFKKVHDEFNYIQTKNQPTIKPDELPYLFQVLNKANIQKPTALLIEWQLLTMLRSSEAVKVEWSEIDFKRKALNLPADKMKGGKRPHSVPLSKQAISILEQMKQYSGNRKYVFCTYSAPYTHHMSSQAANVALKRMGFKGLLVAHGLRAIASTYLHDLDIFSSEAIELCLAHENRGKVRAAYDKSKKWKSRVTIMQTWGDFVEKCKIKAITA
ncbi:integrase [Volucribacter psittacicida]|uniref:Integrase n=1 Tax=Volucribacter psittacicida TaxID=203482 RepID=A0A4V2PBM6_9PAST|nr:integrase arm-type DNA-binding domain-containing protein [Volucribacter psittacicida]TCJ97965.1 integrase [Volucribacter psittacicida]